MLPRVRWSTARGEILAKCALAAVRKGKTMTEHVTGGSEVERDPREMRTRG